VSDTHVPLRMVPYTFDEWLQYGFEHGYCGPPVCHTHDGVPSTMGEVEQFDEGDDPCIHIIRLYPDLATAKAVAAYDLSTQMRTRDLGWDR
jgi:hypothetical protein